MTIALSLSIDLRQRALLAALLMCVPFVAATAQTAQRTAQSSSLRYQQTAQQQHTRDQLQKQQLQQQLRQGVTDNAKRPTANDPRAQQQLDAAALAQRERDRARQQDLIDRERDAANATLQPTPAPDKRDGN